MEMNGEDFSQDVQTNDESMNGNENGAGGDSKPVNGGSGDNNGSAEAPGRDDDRLVGLPNIPMNRGQIPWFYLVLAPS